MVLGLATTAVWTAPAAAVALGTLGALLHMMLRLRGAAPLLPEGRTLREVDAELETHLGALRDLEERSQHAQMPGMAHERAELEAAAARLWEELEALKKTASHRQATAQSAPAAAPGAARPSRISPQLQGALWGAGCTALVAFLLVSVQRHSKQEPVPAAPQPIAAPGAGLERDALAELKERLQRDPNDVSALLQMAHQLLRAQMLDEARTVNERALRIEPLNLEALTHAAVLTASNNDVPGAMAGLAMVLKKDPQFAEAWFFRGMLSMQAGDLTTMRESLTQFLRYAPDGPQKERARAMLQRAQSASP